MSQRKDINKLFIILIYAPLMILKDLIIVPKSNQRSHENGGSISGDIKLKQL